jgi:hypothetical protein
MSELPLNSLDRFRKRSARLILEAHDSGDAPVGCGGILLRWRNPHTAVPLLVAVYSPGKARLFLDGTEVENTGVDLAPGPHQLALGLDEASSRHILFAFAAISANESGHEKPTGLEEAVFRLVSTTDRTWLASLDEPPPNWTGADFDDAGWFALDRALPQPALNWDAPGAYEAHTCIHQGAAFLGLPEQVRGRQRVWVRKRFVVPAPRTT